VRLLLDTHAMYWYIEGDPQLSATAQTLIQDTSNEVFVSPASFWEIAIKISIGKGVIRGQVHISDKDAGFGWI